MVAWIYDSLFNQFPVVYILRNSGLRPIDKYLKFPSRKTVAIYISTNGIKGIHLFWTVSNTKFIINKINKMLIWSVKTYPIVALVCI